VIVALTCATTATTALFCSTVFQKSSTSLIATYLIIIVLFMAPLAVTFFAKTFYGRAEADLVDKVGVLSPFSATFALPLDVTSADAPNSTAPVVGNLSVFFGFIGWSLLYNVGLLIAMMRLFQVRWRVAD
jgi:hypothetical protein